MTTTICDICGGRVESGRQQAVINDKIKSPGGAAFTVELLIQFPQQPNTKPDLCRKCQAHCAGVLAQTLIGLDIKAKQAEPTL
jgi:predicted alpha/beta-hydrolase family hydrolase